jgi:hypothetical protein
MFFIRIFGYKPQLISDMAYTSIMYFFEFGSFPDLKHPITFNEHICALKLEDEKFAYDKYTDKYEVRKYVEQKVGNSYLNKILGIYDSYSEIDFDALPKSFILKATHGSSYNIPVENKKRFNRKEGEKQFRRWLGENFYYKVREKNYFRIIPRIICEEFLKPRDGKDLEEFKLFCFRGQVKFIQHNVETSKGRRACYYDAQWRRLEFTNGYPTIEKNNLPDNRQELIAVAKKLSEDFAFVRVDLYNVDGRIVFSELTFHPGGGYVSFEPNEYDKILGSYF